MTNESPDGASETLVAVSTRRTAARMLHVDRPSRERRSRRTRIPRESIEAVQEVGGGGHVGVLSFQFESGGEGDSNQDFEIVGEAGDEGEEFLGDGHFPSSRFVRVRKEGEEAHDLLAEHSSFPDVGDFWIEKGQIVNNRR